MDQDTAKVLFEDGAMLVLLDVPEGTEFGVDYVSWNVGPKFKGLKMIPPGLHFIYYSACSKSGDTSPRSGFFYNFNKAEIVVRRWDRLAEDLSSEPVTGEEYERIVSNKMELDRFLGPYPYDNYKTWVSLSSHLNGPLVERLQPVSGRISSVTQFVSESSDTQSRKNKMDTDLSSPVALDRLPDMPVVEGSQIRFTRINRRGFPIGSTPSQITQHSLDCSFTLDNFLSNYTNEQDILAEIQFAFICFLIGQVGDAFDQWKRLVHLMCSSGDAVASKSDLYMKFITVLYYHLKEIPADFFVDIISSDNFLTRTLHGFFLSLEEERIQASLKRRGEQLKEYVTKRFSWDFSEEPDDEAPVVVELAENQ